MKTIEDFIALAAKHGRLVEYLQFKPTSNVWGVAVEVEIQLSKNGMLEEGCMLIEPTTERCTERLYHIMGIQLQERTIDRWVADAGAE